jgi:signal transduction histidine kinase
MGFGMEGLLRRLPIRGRILSVAGLNTAVVFLLTLLVLDGAKLLNNAWADLLEVRRTDRILASVETEASRLQSLIHRYFTQPNPEVLAQIERTRASLTDDLAAGSRLRTALNDPTRDLAQITERLVAGFDKLRAVRLDISRIYENEVLRSASDVSGLYAILESTLRGNDGLIVPALAKSREVFSRVLVAANGYYLTFSANSAQEAFSGLDTIDRTLPIIIDLAESDLQRTSLTALRERLASLRDGLLRLSSAFDQQADLLRDAVDRSQDEMTAATATLIDAIRSRESSVQNRLGYTLNQVYWQIAALSIAALLLIALFGTAIARSINKPLDTLIASMDSIVQGRLNDKVHGVDARDELGVMARAIEVFRQNAIAKTEAEQELRASRDRIEAAYADLRNAQRSLIEAEKLAALGGLVAGVAHEVNNPVGISITVASTLARRSADFAAEIERGELRRSRLNEFATTSHEAAQQLVTNLTRAGELIQSFKQVAVDRSHADRRTFDLLQATEQIVASLRPGLSRPQLTLHVTGRPGIAMDSYPGPFGQVLTNLFLNAMTHAFEPGKPGSITIDISEVDAGTVRIDFTDDGRGMDETTSRRAFEPFFTTMRGRGGTGLGLHIVYSVVTRQLGGQLTLKTSPGGGSRFTMVLPRTAPRALAAE